MLLKMLRVTGLSSLLLMVMLGVAGAADMAFKAPPAPVASTSSWAGLYLGVEGGAGWAQSRLFIQGTAITTAKYEQSGGLVGGTFGWNVVVSKNFLFGFEADGSWTGISKTSSQTTCLFAQCFTNMQWLNTDRVRAGWLFGAQNQYLAYVTVGAAGARIQSGQGNGCAPAFCGYHTPFAPVVGAGFEAMILPKLSAKIEYLYTSFGDFYSHNPGTAVSVSERNVNIVRVGLNWHL